MKTCETCKHFKFFLDCGRSPLGKDPVSGGLRYESCSIERDYPWFIWWRCGRRGRFYEEGENYYTEWNKRIDELQAKIDKAAESIKQRTLERKLH